MDILYTYREDTFNCLKYSLRSLKYVNHDKIWVIGDKVPYNVNNIVTEPKERYADSNHNFKIGIEAIGKKKVLLMHDDMFLLPNYKPKKYYNGTIEDYPETGERAEIFRNTLELGINRNYALHYPMPFINDFEFDYKPISIMCFLGNREGFESVKAEDCKSSKPDVKGLPHLLKQPCFSTYQEGEELEGLLQTLYPE